MKYEMLNLSYFMVTVFEYFTAHLCEECGKAFVRERHLQSHKLSHKEPHLKCLKCPYKARMQQSMQRHISRRHQEVTKFFSCHDCGKKFDSAMNFSRHRSNYLSFKYGNFLISIELKN